MSIKNYMKVCWLCNYPSPYAMKQYELISKEIDLTVIMFGGKEENRNDEWKISDNLNFKIILIDDNYNKVIKQLAKDNDIFIDSLYASKYGIIAVNEFKRLKKKTCLLADGGIAIDRGPIINKAISTIMKRHDYFISSGPHCNKYFEFYGVSKKDIYTYRFSSLLEKDINGNKELIKKKTQLRKELGIDDKFTLLSVGRPVKGKGFDILLKAYEKTGLIDKINIYIVGGQPEEEIQEIVDNDKLNNIHFIGLLNSSELYKYYAACDAFILCTRTDVWGLVIQEAMSFGLPVLTSDNCGAGVHYSMLGNSIITCPVENVEKYAEEIVKLYSNKDNVKQLGLESLNLVKDYTIENTAKDIINILKML